MYRWADVLGILEQIVCLQAESFVGTLPSTLSGHVLNARAAAAPPGGGGGGGGAGPLFFVKLHESCCDARTAEDVLRMPGVSGLDEVPCHPHEGNPWC